MGNKGRFSSSLQILILLLFLYGIYALTSGSTIQNNLTVNEFINKLDNGKITSIVVDDQHYTGTYKTDSDKEKKFDVYIPNSISSEIYKENIKPKISEGNLKFNIKSPTKIPWYLEHLGTFVTIAIMIYFFVLTRKMFMGSSNGGGMNPMAKFTKSKAKLFVDSRKPIKFSDVAGLYEEKEELQEIVEFLVNPKKFANMGARVPKGLLMVGNPGTGKTYLSRAVAGEANVPFYSISGSDFVEMYVGVGASRVRDLFNEAKKNSPCIIFIDEIDAVGRKRGAGLGGGNDEREQTLNQLLVEMDGFEQNEGGVIVIAATNRPDILDNALTRPGRFDRQVVVGMPDRNARKEIFQVHLRNKQTDDNIDLDLLARSTSGYSPADIENVCNEAALMTVRHKGEKITTDMLQEASIKVVAGPEKKSKKVIEKERILTAYHEAGHAIVSRVLDNTTSVDMITIVPRGYAGGFTAYSSKEDKTFNYKNNMFSELVSFFGGRAAEQLMLDDISTGASNDIERATDLARQMVTKYGMSNLGPINYEVERSDLFSGGVHETSKSFSEKTSEKIDNEVEAIINKTYSTAIKILTDNKDLLEKLAQLLLEKETVRNTEFESLFNEFKHEENYVGLDI